MDKKDIAFKAVVALGKNAPKQDVPFTVSVNADKDETSLIWDEVEMAAYDAAEELFPESDFPNMEVVEIWVVLDDGEFIVVNDRSDTSGIPVGTKVLELPCALYSLTPEAKAFFEMQESGLIPQNATFNAAEMRKILAIARGK